MDDDPRGDGERGRPPADRARPSRERRGGRMERLGELLPRTARDLGLDEQLDLATAMAAWQGVVSDRLPAATGACRLVGLTQGVATVEADAPIVAQEIRLRAPQLLAALRAAVSTPIRQLRVVMRHV
jgi:predicted nucleic acid-binding Zn ribbon protein